LAPPKSSWWLPYISHTGPIAVDKLLKGGYESFVDSHQVFVLKLPTELARRVLSLVESDNGSYGSVQEFIRVAVENQLHLESGNVPGSEAPYGTDSLSLLILPTNEPPAFVGSVDATDAPLFHMTNRLAPLKIAVRVLANLQAGGAAPTVKEFQRRSASAARALGLRLRIEDVASRGSVRRSVGFPVGEEPELSMARFVTSFTVWSDGGRAAGPLAILGFVGIVDGRAALTESGWRLAVMPTPMLKEIPGTVLSADEAKVLRDAILATAAERAETQALLEIIRSVNGGQSAIDRKLQTEHRDWSQNRVVAHRAALVGRLADVGVVVIEGRGRTARIIPGPAAHELS
jgi:hypothetical protein